MGIALAIILAVPGLLLPTAQAATLTWDASGTNPGNPTDGLGTWSTTGTNWSNGGSDAGWSSLNDAVIGNGGTAGIITIGGTGVSVGNITFNPVASGSSYLITSSTLTLTSGTVTTNAAGASIASVIAGTAGLTTGGTGTLTITTNPTYTGATNVNAGTLVFQNLTSYASATTNIASSGTFILSNTNTTVDNWLLQKPITGTGTLIKNGAGWIDTNGSVFTNFAGSIIINNGVLGNGFLNGTWTNSTANVTVNGPGVFDLRGGNTTATIINNLSGNGTVGNSYTGAETLEVGVAGGSSTFSGSILGNATGTVNTTFQAGTTNLLKVGVGTLTLTGSNSYSGSTTINGGTLAITSTSVDGSLTLGGGALSVSGSQGYTTLATTANTANNITLGASGTLSLTSATQSFGAGSTLNLNDVAGGWNASTVGTGGMKWTTGTPGQLIYGGFTVTDAGGVGFATDNASGQIIRMSGTALTLLPASGATSTASYLVNNDPTGGGTGPGGNALTLTANESAASITVNTSLASGTLGLGGNTLSNDGWLFSSASNANTYLITGGTLQSVTSGDAMFFHNYNAGAVTINAPIVANGSNVVTFDGTGTTVLGGSNSYTGATMVNGGTLQIGNGGTTGTLSTSSAISGSTGATLAFNRSNSVAQGTDFTATAISGGLGIAQNGSGTLSLSSANTFSGGVALNSGTLIAGNNSALGSGTLTLAGGAVSDNGNITLSNPIFVAPNTTTTVSGNSTGQNYLILTGSITGGGTIINAPVVGSNVQNTQFNGDLSGFTGTFVFGGNGGAGNTGVYFESAFNGSQANFIDNAASGSPILLYGITGTAQMGSLSGTGSAAVQANTATVTLQIGALATTSTFAGTLSQNGGTLSLTKVGAGTEILTGANTYTGPTAVNNGRLTITNLSSFASNTSIASGATFEANVASGTQTVGTSIAFTGTGALLKTGTGTWAVGANGPHVNFNLSAGGEIDLQGGTIQNNFNGTSFGSNLGSINIASGAVLDFFAEAGQMDALTGSGILQNSYSAGIHTVTIGVSGDVNNAGYGVAGNTANFAGVIQNGSGGAALSLTKTGSGTQILSGSNTYTGTTTVNGGALQIGNGTSGSISNSSAPTVATGATLAFDLVTSSTYSTNIADSGTVAGAQGAGISNTLGGVISGSGGVMMSGSGKMTLTGLSSYTGNVVINSGTLVSQNAGQFDVQATTSALGNPSTAGRTVTINNGGSLQFGGDNQLGGPTGIAPNLALVINSGGSVIGFNGNLNTLGNITLNGGTLSTNNGFNSGNQSFYLKGGIVTVGGTSASTINTVGTTNTGIQLGGTTTFNVASTGAGTDLTVSVPLLDRPSNDAGTGSLVKTGSGTMLLAGANIYTGPTTVNGGVLIVSGSLSGTVSASVAPGSSLEVDGVLNHSAGATVSGTLDGTGSVGAITANGGGVAPGLSTADSGVSTGALTAAGNVTLSSTSNFNIRLGLSASGTDSDQLVMSGNHTVALASGTLNLSLGAGMSNLTAANVDHLFYVIINGGGNTSFTGTFAGLANDSTINLNGYSFEISYAGTASGIDNGGNDVVLELTAVPEPGTWAMMLAGLGVLCAYQRRRGCRHSSK